EHRDETASATALLDGQLLAPRRWDDDRRRWAVRARIGALPGRRRGVPADDLGVVLAAAAVRDHVGHGRVGFRPTWRRRLTALHGRTRTGRHRHDREVEGFAHVGDLGEELAGVRWPLRG